MVPAVRKYLLERSEALEAEMIQYIRAGQREELHKVLFSDSVFYHTNRISDGKPFRFRRGEVVELVGVGVVPGDGETVRRPRAS